MGILLSKRKIKGNLIASWVLFAACVLMILNLCFNPPDYSESILYNPAFVYGIGGIFALGFGVSGVFYWWKLVHVKPGFIIDDHGIIDNSGVFALGFIPWNDIRYLTVITVEGRGLLVIGIGNPQVYIDREAGLKRTTLQYYYRSYGSPFVVSVSALECTPDELKAAIEEKQSNRSSGG